MPGEIVNDGRPVIRWPEGRRFAFTIFDDPDSQMCEDTREVYSFLADLGFRTTIGVWPLEARRTRNSRGETCANPEYRELLRRFQERGFELGFHNATAHSATREETIEALGLFREYFGSGPAAMANHYNDEAIYWRAARLTGWRQKVYEALMGGGLNRSGGHVPGTPHYWGDVCRDNIRYCRNFVYSDINTLRVCPWMPYFDPTKPYVQFWFSACEGAEGSSFTKALQDRNQDRLEEEAGASIVYTHFGRGFIENGRLHPEFRRLMERLARKEGWFVPVSTLLDFLMEAKGQTVLTAAQRRKLETRWLWEKFFRGTS
ncbi:MAG: hypothetical protein JO033_09245 [Acidobacteriaceae bacterium]|nr:hypothetical protein [Acidobacteriaceae bacterium]MBV9499382.1 hypothetical protein [Acidobacteriaceae bacterium]